MWCTQDFQDNETVLYDATVVDTYYYTFKIHATSNTKNES